MATTVTPYLDAAPCPRVEVFADGFVAGTTHVTLWRMSGGREFRVRGAVMAPVSGAVTRIDFEVPFNVQVTYRVEQFNAAGKSLGFSASATVNVPMQETWMHNPLDPFGATVVSALDTAVSSVSRPVPGTISRPIGRRVGVVLSQPRQGVTGLTFDVWADTFEIADKVQAMLGGYDRDLPPVLCIRKGNTPMRIPAPLFLGVLDATEEDFTVRFGGEDTFHRIMGDEVAPPLPGLFIPLLRRADINAYYSTRAAVAADNLSRIAVARRYDLAGTADA